MLCQVRDGPYACGGAAEEGKNKIYGGELQEKAIVVPMPGYVIDGVFFRVRHPLWPCRDGRKGLAVFAPANHQLIIVSEKEALQGTHTDEIYADTRTSKFGAGSGTRDWTFAPGRPLDGR